MKVQTGDEVEKVPGVLLEAVQEAKASQYIHIRWARNWGSKCDKYGTRVVDAGKWAKRHIAEFEKSSD